MQTLLGSALVALVVLTQTSANDAAVQRVLDDYIRLYTNESLAQWKTLFLPGFTASYTNDDGTITTRNLEEFYERQRTAFASGEVSETLHNVRIQRAGRLAQVVADFRFTSRGSTRPGQLMLLMIEDRGQLKIAALTFTYHLAREFVAREPAFRCLSKNRSTRRHASSSTCSRVK